MTILRHPHWNLVLAVVWLGLAIFWSTQGEILVAGVSALAAAGMTYAFRRDRRART